MGVEVPAGFALVAWRFGLAGDPEEMVTTCGIDITGADGNNVEVANNCARAFGNQFPASEIDADWQFRGCRAFVSDGGGSLVPYDSVGMFIQGTASGTGPVQNTAVLVKKATTRPGRQGRGRFYWPPFGLSTGSYSPNGVLVSGTLTSYQTKFSNMYNLMVAGTGAGLTFVVHPFLLHSDADAPNEITAFTVQAQLATQRRRLRK